jgi:mono/diheme cytochrome c family protein
VRRVGEIHPATAVGTVSDRYPMLDSDSPSQKRRDRRLRHLGLCGALLVVLSTILLSACSSGPEQLSAQATEDPSLPPWAPSATLVGPNPRLAGPGLSRDSTQVDKGAMVYWAICMACHGDRGQGLTDEWRAAWGLDSNCWASKCHAPNHPPEGFSLPKIIPGILGPGTMSRFGDARELHTYIADTMPWWNPGSLTPEQSLAVTAYLLDQRKAVPKGTQLDDANLSAFNPLREVRDRPFEKAFVVGAVGLLAAAVLGIAARRSRSE